jgi:hypothetical protein
VSPSRVQLIATRIAWAVHVDHLRCQIGATTPTFAVVVEPGFVGFLRRDTLGEPDDPGLAGFEIADFSERWPGLKGTSAPRALGPDLTAKLQDLVNSARLRPPSNAQLFARPYPTERFEGEIALDRRVRDFWLNAHESFWEERLSSILLRLSEKARSRLAAGRRVNLLADRNTFSSLVAVPLPTARRHASRDAGPSELMSAACGVSEDDSFRIALRHDGDQLWGLVDLDPSLVAEPTELRLCMSPHAASWLDLYGDSAGTTLCTSIKSKVDTDGRTRFRIGRAASPALLSSPFVESIEINVG